MRGPWASPNDPRITERLYTREEWEDLQRRETCQREGHDYEVIANQVANVPTKVICIVCGASWQLATNQPRVVESGP